ncbi:hypothetical protein GCM10022631_18690 [Deinococcus rubellus]|uniref:GAF domain-containing sensor histidine kinase n=1 Tax=Deinococcus rubellus TaxID=1889240 RepID=A0ABY5YHM3_9DEIO|nr:GAF domain-containing sensor histidine kinase [Deinococcus rubellus]UWX63666.1 GAF domain-containing sensor histidine kinase [Deinococcus rubellus]
MQVRPPLVSTPGSARRLLWALETWVWPALLLVGSAALISGALHPRWLDLVWQVRDLTDTQWPAAFTRLRLWLDGAQTGLAALSAALLLTVGGRQRYPALLGVLGVGLASSQLWPVPAGGLLSFWLLLGAAWLWGLSDLRRLERPQRVSRVVLWGYGSVLLTLLVWTFGVVPLELSGAALDRVPPGLLWNELIRPGVRDLGLAALLLCAVLAYAEQSPGAVRGGLLRGLVFGGLSLGTALLFSVVVGGFSALLHTSGTLWPSLVAAGLVAALIEPARSALSRSLRRLLYGERDDPSGVMQGLARQLESSGGAAPLRTGLENALAGVAAALRLPFVALRFADGEVLSCGQLPAQPPEILPLTAQGEFIGTLEVARRTQREAFSKAEWALLEGVARQLAVSAHAWHLAEQLQASQDHLIRAGEEERRRLRRDLHDGLGPSLAGLGLKLEAARLLLTRSPERAAEQLSALREEVQESVSEVRRLVHDLRPPKLDDLGLVGALEELLVGVRQTGLDASLELKPLPPLGAALEVAVYRIAQEALTNVMKHARASQVSLSLSAADGLLTLECRDDGVGLPDVREPGVGSRSMRERAGALSGTLELAAAPAGGTLVRARLPLAAVRPGV